MNIIAVKIHEDTREYLPPYMKYCQQPLNEKEYENFLNKGENGNRGLGFHECMNFKVCDDNMVKFYLPPGYIPSLKRKGPFIIIWISYSPRKILGIQYNANIYRDKQSHLRDDSTFRYQGTPLDYHGITNSEYSILFNTPIELKESRHLPKFRLWGNGLRYLKPCHVKNIITDRIKSLNKNRNSYENKELRKLHFLANYLDFDISKNNKKDSLSTASKIPDKELGDWGEEFVYKDQLKIAQSFNIPQKKVFRIALIDPQSVYDIESIKPTSNGYEKLYIEVKTTHDLKNPSIFISQRQINFAREHKKNHVFAFVDATKQTIRYLNIDDIDDNSEFFLAIEKYRLKVNK